MDLTYGLSPWWNVQLPDDWRDESSGPQSFFWVCVAAPNMIRLARMDQ